MFCVLGFGVIKSAVPAFWGRRKITAEKNLKIKLLVNLIADIWHGRDQDIWCCIFFTLQLL